MKIQYCSDLHLEFFENQDFLKENPIQQIGDILILAGDILPFNYLKDNSIDFFKYISDKFEMIYWLPGNHEYYRTDINIYDKILNKEIHPNFHLVNNQVIKYNDVNLIFTTLWTKISLVGEYFVSRGVNDFRVIKNKNGIFSTSDCNLLCDEALKFIKKSTQPDQKNIIITHHVPTKMNYPEKYKDSVINEAFAVELFDFISDNKIDYWVYGHSHCNTPDFKIGNTNLITNQVGYVHHSEHKDFKLEAIIEI